MKHDPEAAKQEAELLSQTPEGNVARWALTLEQELVRTKRMLRECVEINYNQHESLVALHRITERGLLDITAIYQRMQKEVR